MKHIPGEAYPLPVSPEVWREILHSRIRFGAYDPSITEWLIGQKKTDTHWCIMPEIPKPNPKTQEDIDRDEFERTWHSDFLAREENGDYAFPQTDIGWRQFQRAIAYARKP